MGVLTTVSVFDFNYKVVCEILIILRMNICVFVCLSMHVCVSVNVRVKGQEKKNLTQVWKSPSGYEPTTNKIKF